MNYVWENSPYTGTKKLIHLAIADVVNDMHDNEFFMTNENLAQKATCSREYANRVLKEMVAAGALEELGRKGIVIKYRFLFQGVTRVHSKCDESSQVSVTRVHTEPNSKTNETQNPLNLLSESDESEEKPKRAVQVQAVWDAYIRSREEFQPKGRHPVFSDARKRLIRGWLEKGYSEEDLVLAVTGWVHSSHHCGDNDEGKIYNTLELILRNDGKIDQFIGYHDKGKKSNSRKTISDKWGNHRSEKSNGNMGVSSQEDWDG